MDINGRGSNGLDGEIVQFLDRRRTSIHIHVVFEGADLRRPGRQDEILRADRIHHVQRRQSVRLQGSRVQVHLNLTLLATVRIRYSRARYGSELRPDEVQPQVIQLLLRKRGAGKSELKNRNAGGAVSNDQRRCGSGRKLFELSLGLARNLRDRSTDIRTGMEEHLDDSNAVKGLRFQMLDVIDRGG